MTASVCSPSYMRKPGGRRCLQTQTDDEAGEGSQEDALLHDGVQALDGVWTSLLSGEKMEWRTRFVLCADLVGFQRLAKQSPNRAILAIAVKLSDRNGVWRWIYRDTPRRISLPGVCHYHGTRAFQLVDSSNHVGLREAVGSKEGISEAAG